MLTGILMIGSISDCLVDAGQSILLKSAMAACYVYMPSLHAMVHCYVLHGMAACYGRVLQLHAMAACCGCML